MRKQIKKYLLILLGSLFVVLGIIGAVLPILPTTPFLLLALACFAKSSPFFHQILLNNRWFGSALQQWEKDKSISRKSKIRAIIMIVLTFSVSIVILDERSLLQSGLVAMGSSLLIFMWRLKEADVTTVKTQN